MEEKTEKEQEKKFDLMVTHRDPLTGQITKRDPYVMYVMKSAEGGKMRLYERPKGSGNLWNSKGEPIGRWDKSKKEGEQFIKGAKHIDWVQPLTKDQQIAKENAALKAEIAAMKAESDKKKEK